MSRWKEPRRYAKKGEERKRAREKKKAEIERKIAIQERARALDPPKGLSILTPRVPTKDAPAQEKDVPEEDSSEYTWNLIGSKP